MMSVVTMEGILTYGPSLLEKLKNLKNIKGNYRIFTEQMEKKYYKYGTRPIIEEIEPEFSTFYAYQWDTGEFKEDMTYASKIWYDSSGDREDLSEEEFNTYLEKLRQKKDI